MKCLEAACFFLCLCCCVICGVNLGKCGEITGRVTNLKGEPRAGIELSYEVNGRNIKSNKRYSIKPMDNTKTNNGDRDPNMSGSFRLVIPEDQFEPGTQEVFVTVISPGLQPVELNYFLGTAYHDVTIVMREAKYELKTLEVPQIALTGSRGTFHLAGTDGTALYTDHYSGELRLVPLTYTKNDEHFWYYSETGETDRHWAFATKPINRYLFRKRRWTTCDGYRVWFYDGEKWMIYDTANRIIPSNANSKGTVQLTERIEVFTP